MGQRPSRRGEESFPLFPLELGRGLAASATISLNDLVSVFRRATPPLIDTAAASPGTPGMSAENPR